MISTRLPLSEVQRRAAAIASEDMAVDGMGRSMLIERAPENGDDGHVTLAALFGLVDITYLAGRLPRTEYGR